MSSKIDNEEPADKANDYRKMVDGRVIQEAEALAAAEKKKTGGGERRGGDKKITSEFVLDCLYSNELGDGILFAEIHKNKFLYDNGVWMSWVEHFWKEDLQGEALSAVEKVAVRYLSEAKNIGDRIDSSIAAGDKDTTMALQKTQGNLYKRAFRLRSNRGRQNCLEFARANPVNSLSVPYGKFNTNPYLFACKNGVIDLRTGLLRPGRPDDFISKASPVEFTGISTLAPNWEKALKEIFEDRQPLIDFVCRLFGYSMAGLTVEAFLPVFFGQGRNGKSTIVEIVSHVMGDMAASIRAELLLDQGFLKSSAAASPDIMALRDLRLAIAQETDQGRRFSTSKIQWLTGSDTMTGRYLYDKRDVEFIPTHTLILLTNHKPTVNDNDFAFWERVCLVPFPLSFVTRRPERENERVADKNLRQKLLAEESGILAWLVRGFIQWQECGLDPPAIVVDATKDYKMDEDLIGHFILECCIEVKGAETPAKDLYDRFRDWWATNVSRKPLSQKRFGGMFGKRFLRSKSGTCRYFGVGLLEDEN